MVDKDTVTFVSRNTHRSATNPPLKTEEPIITNMGQHGQRSNHFDPTDTKGKLHVKSSRQELCNQHPVVRGHRTLNIMWIICDPFLYLNCSEGLRQTGVKTSMTSTVRL